MGVGTQKRIVSQPKLSIISGVYPLYEERSIMSKLDILNIIIKLLVLDNAQGLDKPAVKAHLNDVASAIYAEGGVKAGVPHERLISLAYNESRFGYKYVGTGTYPKTSWGACGVYQQVPAYSTIPTTCDKLGKNIRHATKVAVGYLKYMRARWKVSNTDKMDTLMCHYYSGNTCDVEAKGYASRHKKIRLKAISLVGKKKVVVGKKKVVVASRKKGLPPATI